MLTHHHLYLLWLHCWDERISHHSLGRLGNRNRHRQIVCEDGLLVSVTWLLNISGLLLV